MPTEHTWRTGRPPKRSTIRPQSGADAMRTSATATPCAAASANPVPSVCSMCREKKLADSPTAAFQARR